MRDTETRPISWRIAISGQVNDAINAYGLRRGDTQAGFLAEALFSRMLATRDNLGRMPADKYTLKGMLFPISNCVSPDDLQTARDILSDVGLIIVYSISGSEYLVLPKAGEYSRLYGNMAETSQCPEPPEGVIKDWEARFNDVYTPCERRSNNVRTPFEQRSYTVRTPFEQRLQGAQADKNQGSDGLKNMFEQQFREGEGEVEGEVEVEGEEGRKKKVKKAPPAVVKSGSDVKKAKPMTEVQAFVDGFEKTYQHLSGSQYRHSRKDFILVTDIVKKFGIEEVLKKTRLLAVMCQRGKSWPAKNGPADFTIGNLCANWNSILPQTRLTPEEIKTQEFVENIRKERARRERLAEQA